MDSLSAQIRHLLHELLPGSGSKLTDDTPLLGEIPEFDSMLIVQLLENLEESFDIEIDDDELTAELFTDVRSLAGFIAEKVGAEASF